MNSENPIRVKVFNRLAVPNEQPDDRHLYVSITSMDGEWPLIKRRENCCGIVYLQFDDADVGENLFDDKMARQIFEAIEEHDPAVVVVNCDAGLSRSPAVAAALLKVYTGDDTQIFGNTFFKPNRHVYRTMIYEALERGLV